MSYVYFENYFLGAGNIYSMWKYMVYSDDWNCEGTYNCSSKFCFTLSDLRLAPQ